MSIQEQYPRMFIPQFWGIEVGDGWKPLVDEVVTRLAQLPDPPQITQVKEKFGNLTIYLTSYSPDAQDILDEVEERASLICEYCGAPGEERDTGWIKVLCDACEEKRSNR
jgi:hypothetical protein